MEPTPQTGELEAKLRASDETLAAFKNDPRPLLREHGIEPTPEEHEQLKQHLAGHDLDEVKSGLEQDGLCAMFSQKA